MASTQRRHGFVVAALTAVLLFPGQASYAQDEPTAESIRRTGVWLDFNFGIRDLRIQTIAIDPQEPLRMYAGGRGFVYRSVNGGETWQVVYSLQVGGTGTSVGSSEISPDVNDIDDLAPEVIDRVEERYEELQNDMYADVSQGSDEYTATIVVEAASDELLERALREILEEEMPSGSADVFRPDPLTIPDNLFTHIVIDPNAPNRVFAASGRGVAMTEDYGATWNRMYRGVGEERRRVRAIALAGDNVVLATASGMQISSDLGQSWQRNAGSPAREAVRFVVASPSHPERLYAQAAGRIYRSIDGGVSWVPMTVPQGVPQGEFSNIAVDLEDPDIVYLGTGSGVMRSTNAGGTFQLMGLSGLRERRVTWVTLFRGAILVGTPDGFYISLDDGTSWDEISNGLSAALIRQISISAEGDVWLATQTGTFKRVPQEELHPSMETVRELQEQWAYEPDLARTVNAALRFNAYDDIEIEAWSRRIFWSRFLPDVRFQYMLFQYRDEIDIWVPDEFNNPLRDSFDFRTRDANVWQVMVLWDIGDLILDSRQVSQRDVGDRLIRRRRDLIRRTISLYDSRRELMFRIAAGDWTTLARNIDNQLSLAELTGRLNALTGGYFTAFTEVHSR